MALTLTAFEVETHAGIIHHQFQVADIIGTDKCVFFAKREGDKCNLPVFKKGTAKNIADGATNLLTTESSAVTELGPELLVDDPLRDWQTVKESEVDLKADIGLPLHYSKRVGNAIGEGKQLRILNYLAAIAESGEGAEVPDLGTTVTAADLTTRAGKTSTTDGILVKIDELNASMTLAGVPLADRFLFLEPNSYSILSSTQQVVDTRWNQVGGGFNARPGIGPILYANFMIYNAAGLSRQNWAADTNLSTKYRIDMRKVYGVAWHRDSWALRHVKEPTTGITYHAELNSWLIQGRLHMGAQVIDATGLGVIKSTA